MKYLVGMYHESTDTRVIINDDTKCHIGTIVPVEPKRRGPPYRVSNSEGAVVAVVKSVPEAVWALSVHYKNNPPRWECRSAIRYERYTEYAELRVGQNEAEFWWASRACSKLMRDGQIVMFAMREDAQRAADRHERDGCSNSATIDDGLSWPLPVDPEGWLTSDAIVDRDNMEVFYP
jgi:hypothetical protein